MNNARSLVHDADNTNSMLAIQDLVHKARHASEEVQKGIIARALPITTGTLSCRVDMDKFS